MPLVKTPGIAVSWPDEPSSFARRKTLAIHLSPDRQRDKTRPPPVTMVATYIVGEPRRY